MALGATYAWHRLSPKPSEGADADLRMHMAKALDAEGAQAIMNATLELHQAGLRPASPDRRPTVGPWPGQPRGVLMLTVWAHGVCWWGRPWPITSSNGGWTVSPCHRKCVQNASKPCARPVTVSKSDVFLKSARGAQVACANEVLWIHDARHHFHGFERANRTRRPKLSYLPNHGCLGRNAGV